MDIVEVIGSLVKLEKTGNDYIGLCPFHNDHNPSMRVMGKATHRTYKKHGKVFKCFVCGVGGHTVDFIYMFYGCKTYKRAKNVLANFSPKPYQERKQNTRLMHCHWVERRISYNYKKSKRLKRRIEGWMVSKPVDNDTEGFPSSDSSPF